MDIAFHEACFSCVRLCMEKISKFPQPIENAIAGHFYMLSKSPRSLDASGSSKYKYMPMAQILNIIRTAGIDFALSFGPQRPGLNSSHILIRPRSPFA
ncbi:hypothetical protein CEXT_348631 [Caerostris extrusa]|uniref:Uncharacterized protein n=1 Tax=Caerostris extrusa TaxID=172846 RepID=A0AAV4XTP4_CAEEX|nr:hypothetical protein CEXT_348631 [Caerostris extrusa]